MFVDLYTLSTVNQIEKRLNNVGISTITFTMVNICLDSWIGGVLVRAYVTSASVMRGRR